MNKYRQVNAFCSLTSIEHSQRRRRFSHLYSKTALFGSGQLASVTESILYERFLPRLHALQQGAETSFASHDAVDALRLSYSLGLDYITGFIFGCSGGSNFLQGIDSIQEWLERYETYMCKEAFWPQELPETTRWLRKLGYGMLPTGHEQSKSFLEVWLLSMCRRADVVLELRGKGEHTKQADTPVVYGQIKHALDLDQNQSCAQKRLTIASELFDHACR